MAHSAALSLTEGRLSRQMLRYSAPLMLTNLLQVLFNMTDLAVVGRFASAGALGSVGSTSTLVFLFTGFLMGLGSGVNVLVATHYGARSEKNVRESVHTSFLICLAAGFIILAMGLLFPPAPRTAQHARRPARRRGALYAHLLPRYARHGALQLR